MLLENSIFQDQVTKDKILKDEETLSNIFWINILGFLALKSYGHHAKLDHYFRTEKVQLKAITDASADLMLIVKLCHDNGNINLSIANELTKLLALIKQDKIQQVDELKFRDLIGKIVLSKLTPDSIVKKTVTSFENGTYTLKDCIKPLYQYAKMHKICDEFVDIAKLMVNNLDDNDAASGAPKSTTATLMQTMKKRGRPAGSKNKVASSGITLVQAPPAAIPSSVSTHDQLLKSKTLFNLNSVVDQVLLVRKLWKLSDRDIKKLCQTETVLKSQREIEHFLRNWSGRIANIIIDNLSLTKNTATSRGEDCSVFDKLEPIDKTYFTPFTAYNIFHYFYTDNKQLFIEKYKSFNNPTIYDITLWKMHYFFIYKKGTHLGFSSDSLRMILNEFDNSPAKFLKWGFLEEGKELEGKGSTTYHSGDFETAFEALVDPVKALLTEEQLISIAQPLFYAYTTYKKFTIEDFSKKPNLLLSFTSRRLNILKNKDFVNWLKKVGLEGNKGFESKIIDSISKISKHNLGLIWRVILNSGYIGIDDKKILREINPSEGDWVKIIKDKDQFDEFLQLSNPFLYTGATFNLGLLLNALDKLPRTNEFYDKIISMDFSGISAATKDLDALKLPENSYLLTKIRAMVKKENLPLRYSEDIKLFSILFSTNEMVKQFLLKEKRLSVLVEDIDDKKELLECLKQNKEEFIDFVCKMETLWDFSNYILESLYSNQIMWPVDDDKLNDKLIEKIKSFGTRYTNDIGKVSNFLSLLKAPKYIIDSISNLTTKGSRILSLKDIKMTSISEEINNLIKDTVKSATDQNEIERLVNAIFTNTYNSTSSSVTDYINLEGNEELQKLKDQVLTKGIKLIEDKRYDIKYLKFSDVNDNSEDYSLDNKLKLMEMVGSYFGGKPSYNKGTSRKLNKEAASMIDNYQGIFFDLFEDKKTRKKLDKILDSFGDRKNKVFKQLRDSVFVEPIINEIMGSDTPIKPLVKLDHKGIKNILKMNNFDLADIKLRRKKNETDTEYLERAIQEKEIMDVEQLKLKVQHADKTPDQLKKKSAELYQYYTKNWAHGDKGLQILEEFEANIEPEEFTKFKPLYSNTVMVPVFHGTGSVAASMILRFGFKVLSQQEATASGVGFAGRMLGNGLYVGGFVDKTCGYIRDGSNWANRWGQVGYLFEIEAVMGNDREHHRKAGDGGDGIKSIEYCLFNPRAQAKILKVYKVQVIKRTTIESWYKELYPNGISESNTEFPTFYDYYLKEDKLKSFKEFLIEKQMPNKNIVEFTFHDDYIPISMTEQLEVNAFIKRFAKKGNPIKVYECQDGNRVEIMTNSEEWLNVTVPDTDEFMVKNPEGLFHQWLFFLKRAS